MDRLRGPGRHDRGGSRVALAPARVPLPPPRRRPGPGRGATRSWATRPGSTETGCSRPGRCRLPSRSTTRPGWGRSGRPARRPGPPRTPVLFGAVRYTWGVPQDRDRRSRRPRAQPEERRPSRSRATGSWSSPACPGAGRAASPSTRSTPRASGATSRACRPTPASSWARWRSRTSTRSTASRRPSRSTRRAPAATRARPSARSPRSTTTCGCCSPGSAIPTARSAAARSSARPSSRSSTRSWRMPEGTRLLVLGPLVKDRKTEGDRIFEAARKQGFVRVRVDGESYDLAEAPTLDKYKRHTIEVVVDRFIVRRAEAPDDGARDAPAGRSTRRTAWPSRTRTRPPRRLDRDRPPPRRGRRPHRPGAARGRGRPTSRSAATPSATRCPYDGTTIDELEPRSFSFNSPHGACPTCTGLGTQPRDRPRPRHPGPLEERRQGRRRPVGADADRRVVADEDHRGRLRGPRLGSEGAPPRPPARGDRAPPLLGEGQGREGRHPLQARAGRELVRGDLRGRRHQPRAALPGDRVRVHQDRAREVHGRAALPGLRAASGSGPRRSR